MQIVDIILTFSKLGDFILAKENADELKKWFAQARNTNGWFTEDNCQIAIDNIAKAFLNEEVLKQFVSNYESNAVKESKKIGIIAAGNIPFVGFHDLLCTVLSGNIALIKLSRDDYPLMLNLITKLFELNSNFKSLIQLEERLNAADAYIGTGSDNSARYFEFYFKQKPSIIRRNRTSIAILSGEETGSDLRNLGNDIFQFFGLGCRNVSKLLVPEGYVFNTFFENIAYWNTIQLHHKYNNNYDYNKSIYLVNRVAHLDNGFLLLKEDDSLVSPLGVIFYETYSSKEQLRNYIETYSSKLQCIVSSADFGEQAVGFGGSQVPSISDFADQVDTMKFLTQL